MSGRLHLRIGRGMVSARAVQRRRIVWAAEAPFTDPEDLREVIAQLAGEESLPIRLASMRVKLESPLAQVRTLEGLPPVKERALRALVAQQAGRFFRKNGKPLVVDAGGFRDKQVERLRGIAQKMGEKALQTKQIVELQPMTPHDRRIVHMAIAEIPGLSSRSEGEGEDRHILVVPAPAE